MSPRERNRTERQREDHTAEAQPTSAGRERVESIRQNAQQLLSTARRLIDETLSGESEDYLNAVRQQGGQ